MKTRGHGDRGMGGRGEKTWGRMAEEGNLKLATRNDFYLPSP